MRRREVSAVMLLTLILAVTLIIIGMVFGFREFFQLEQLAMRHEDHQMLLKGVEGAAVRILLFGSLAAWGMGILVILVLHLLRSTSRIYKEAEALRAKKEAAEALTRQNQELAHHQRLQTLGTLTSSIAHEFNNLLTPIMGYSLMAMEKLPPEEEGLHDDLLEIYNASKKAKVIISRLSDLSRKNTDNSFREVSTDEVIQKTVEVAEPARPDGVEVRLNLNCWDQRLRANEIQLTQLLLNLILNAFQAMKKEGGVLTITSSFDEKDLHIQVKDTGCGMDENTREKAFEPFFTTKERGQGTGLGLAIAAQVVEDHRGKIRLESSPGKGAVITVSLPRKWKEQ